MLRLVGDVPKQQNALSSCEDERALFRGTTSVRHEDMAHSMLDDPAVAVTGNTRAVLLAQGAFFGLLLRATFGSAVTEAAFSR